MPLLPRHIGEIKVWPSRLIQGFVLFLLLHSLFPLPSPKPWSKVILARDGSMLAAYLSEDDKWRLRTGPEDISSELLEALIYKEDKHFYHHPGVNPVALGRAFFQNIFSGKRVSGASTITMQVVRLLEPRPRTYLSKLVEIFRAFQLEWVYTKEEILEMYLSYLPYGGNVEGIRAASMIYFDRPPENLSLAQSVLLTVIPNRPNSLRLDRNQTEALEMRNRWLKNFAEEGLFPENQIEHALYEPIDARRHQLQPKAPHFCLEVKDRFPGDRIQSSLDPDIQLTAERLLANYVNRVRSKGVSNGAVLVVDNERSEVLAYCGSADFFDSRAAGQCNGVTAIRSPGSTLKPALYALAFDEGLLTPGTILHDIPVDFKGYSPENYDLNYHGPVTVEFALRNSLNVPPVRILNQIGVRRFIGLLGDAGLETVRKQADGLGLSVILGGCGTTLEELVRLFSGFAREGEMHELNYLRQDSAEVQPEGKELFSPASAWMIAEILSGIERPDIPQDFLAAAQKTRIAWKTGTSYGKRDAWSVGFSPRYTIGVWMGNFDGQGAPDLSGSVMAVPLLLDIFNALEDPADANEWFSEPVTLSRREVCAGSGQVPDLHCTQTEEDFYIRKVSSQRPCELERMLYVSLDSSIQYCTECLPAEEYTRAAWPIYAPELTLWFENNNRSYPHLPMHNPECVAALSGEGPTIISPSPNKEYLLERGAGQEILLQAASGPSVTLHYWYVNGVYFRSARPGERLFFSPRPGTNRISCMDNKGRENHLETNVKFY